MRFWPRSLLWRSVALLAALLVVGQLAAVAVLELSLAEPRIKRVTQQIASVVNVTRAALLSSEPGKRRALLSDLASREGLRIYPVADRQPPRRGRSHPVLRRLEAALRKELGAATRLGLGPGNGRGALWVSFEVADGRYWLVMPRARIEQPPFPWRWLGWIAAVLAVAVAGAWFIVHRLGRPLERLAAASAAIGRGDTPQSLAEEGPEELRALARSFNRMAADLERLENDRKLLLAGVSHDLRTPLARLRLQVEMLDGPEAPTTRESMVQDIEDMDAIIGQFLDFVREGGSEEPTLVDLDALVAETARRYSRLGHAVQADTGGLPPIELRATAMQRLLANLVDNALTHGRPAGASEAEVVLRTWSRSGRVFLSVLDRGPGIDEQEAERLRQPFTRLDPDRAGSGGSGLGLAIVDRIVRAHAGTLELLMRAGGGLEVRVGFARGAPARPA